MQSARSGPLSGGVCVPGDKSISHRALILAASAVGESRITGLLESEDVLATVAAVSALGADVERGDDGAGGVWRVRGLGVGGMAEPEAVLDMGNSGTAARLLIGLVAGRDITCTFTGDASLSARPMARVIEPLERMGASFTSRQGGRLPLTVTGPASPMPIEYELPVASAQVKSAILLAALGAPGQTVVIEPRPSRDHTERMLKHFGAELTVEELGEGDKRITRITITGQPELSGHDVEVPGDMSSAAFPIVAALINPGSVVTLRGVGINPLRAGLIESLREMGGRIDLANRRNLTGEPVADITVSSSPLTGIYVQAACAPSMIDEYPILAVAAALASGDTRMEGLAELRVKESDRLAAITRGLRACGVGVEEGGDWLTVHGLGRPPAGGAVIETNLDHRIAMAFLVLGGVTARPVTIDDGAPIETSFPGFKELMNGLGASMGASMGASIREAD